MILNASAKTHPGDLKPDRLFYLGQQVLKVIPRYFKTDNQENIDI